jgi:hypothetical protein
MSFLVFDPVLLLSRQLLIPSSSFFPLPFIPHIFRHKDCFKFISTSLASLSARLYNSCREKAKLAVRRGRKAWGLMQDGQTTPMYNLTYSFD